VSTLTPQQLSALRDVARAWPGVPAVLIGAGALACQIASFRRQTNDLDLVVAIGMEDIGRLSDLRGWKPLPQGGEQSWQSPGRVRIDLLPASQRLLASGVLRWPRSGMEMKLVGLRLAFDASRPLDVGEGLSVLLASVPAVAVLKVIAFLDRPDSREKDLEDLAFLLEDYLVDPERRFEMIGADPGIDYENTSAFALGLDAGRLVNDDERRLVARFIAGARAEDSRTAARLLRLGPVLWRADPTCLRARLSAFERGLSLAPAGQT
jgi:predicted nucleotidyltransferase